eukprot:1286765-Pyramimonas_sp.AAC.1
MQLWIRRTFAGSTLVVTHASHMCEFLELKGERRTSKVCSSAQTHRFRYLAHLCTRTPQVVHLPALHIPHISSTTHRGRVPSPTFHPNNSPRGGPHRQDNTAVGIDKIKSDIRELHTVLARVQSTSARDPTPSADASTSRPGSVASGRRRSGFFPLDQPATSNGTAPTLC